MTVRLVRIDLSTFRSLAAHDRSAVQRDLGLTSPVDFVESADASGIWAFMVDLLEGHPENADWAMQLVVHEDVVVGNAGFKGAPVDGQVELGYRISPDHRGRGLAVAAVHLLIERATLHPDVDRVVARIKPGNDASVAVVTKAGLVPDGDHIHPRWGRQLQYVQPLPRATRQ